MFLLSDLSNKINLLSREINRGKSVNSMNVRALIAWLVKFDSSGESEELREAIAEYLVQKNLKELKSEAR